MPAIFLYQVAYNLMVCVPGILFLSLNILFVSDSHEDNANLNIPVTNRSRDSSLHIAPAAQVPSLYTWTMWHFLCKSGDQSFIKSVRRDRVLYYAWVKSGEGGWGGGEKKR